MIIYMMVPCCYGIMYLNLFLKIMMVIVSRYKLVGLLGS